MSNLDLFVIPIDDYSRKPKEKILSLREMYEKAKNQELIDPEDILILFTLLEKGNSKDTINYVTAR